jgi:D-threo-aldose 1-dehydrogenase
MAKIETRRLGRTALDVTVLGLGCAPLGNLLTPMSNDQATATVTAALAAGVRYFDVAPQYGHGLAEHRLGHVLREVPRNDFVLSSKVGRILRASRAERVTHPLFADPLPFDMTDEYTRDAILRTFEDSYQRLGLNRIDIVYIHNIDPVNHTPAKYEALFKQAMDETYPALDELRRNGIVTAIGVGNNYAEVCERFARAGDFDCFLLAGRYTLLEQGALDSFLPYCEQRNIAMVCGGPYNSGILATGPTVDAHYNYAGAPRPVLDRVRRIDAVCRAHKVPLAAAALQFPLGHRCVASVIPGARSTAEMEQNARLMDHPVPAALWRDLKSAGLLRADAPTPDG